jgi:hypothetical protein
MSGSKKFEKPWPQEKNPYLSKKSLRSGGEGSMLLQNTSRGTRKPASGNSFLRNSNALTGYLTAEGINTKRLAAP